MITTRMDVAAAVAELRYVIVTIRHRPDVASMRIIARLLFISAELLSSSEDDLINHFSYSRDQLDVLHENAREANMYGTSAFMLISAIKELHSARLNNPHEWQTYYENQKTDK